MNEGLVAVWILEYVDSHEEEGALRSVAFNTSVLEVAGWTTYCVVETNIMFGKMIHVQARGWCGRLEGFIRRYLRRLANERALSADVGSVSRTS